MGLIPFVSIVSRQITSEARALPPGEFTLRTIAFTFSSSLASFIAFAVPKESVKSV